MTPYGAEDIERLRLYFAGYTAKDMAEARHTAISTMIEWHSRRGLPCNGGSGWGGKRKKGGIA